METTFLNHFFSSLKLCFVLVLLFLVSACSSSDPEAEKAEIWDGLSEEEQHLSEWATTGFALSNGLDATLFASEPVMMSPSNLDIDHRGRIWVVDVINYRPGSNPNNEPREEGDKILILEDTTGDGIADTETVFYQGRDIDAALGIAVFGNRVIVSSAPNVFIFTDTDGDDVADTKEVLFSGIGGVQHDHSVHAFVFGPDGNLYFNMGNTGDQLMDADGNMVVDETGNAVQRGDTYREGMIFRTNFEGGEFEVLAHNFRNNYEVAIDSYGSMWQSDNDDDGNQSVRINYVMEYGNYGYDDQITGEGWRSRRINMEELTNEQHWHQNDPGVVPNLLITGAGSPTGIIVYEGDLLPDVYHGEVIHTDAGPNVVRAYPVEDDGAGYSATVENVVVSRDQWFRPSDVAVAPDGSIFVADWYDPGVGGHRQRDLERGRIFRIAPPNTPYTVPEYDFDTVSGAIEAIQSPNMAVRYLAWTSLNEMQADAEDALLGLWESENPIMRARALWLLGNIEGQASHYVAEALADENPDIRITGLRMARDLELDLIPLLQQLTDDASPQVRREVAIALRHNTSDEAAGIWADLALQHDGQDRWYLEALGIGADLQWDRYFDAWLERADDHINTAGGQDIIWRARTDDALPYLANLIIDSNSAEEQLRYFRAFDFHDDASASAQLVNLLEVSNHPLELQIHARTLQQLDAGYVTGSTALMQTLNETVANLDASQLLVDIIVKYELDDQNERLFELALTHSDEDLKEYAMDAVVDLGGMDMIRDAINSGNIDRSLATLEIISSVNSDEIDALFEEIITSQNYDFRIQTAAIQSMGSGGGSQGDLLDMLTEGRIPAALEPIAADLLMNSFRATVREQAAQYMNVTFSTPATSNLPPVSELITRTGNASNGQVVFERTCAVCHIAEGVGIQFGPELTVIGGKLPKLGLATKILNPADGVVMGFEAQTITMTDGDRTMGIVESETDTYVDLRMMGGATERIQKSDIETMEQMDQSMMPPGLAQTMTETELVDLLEYLSNLR